MKVKVKAGLELGLRSRLRVDQSCIECPYRCCSGGGNHIVGVDFIHQPIHVDTGLLQKIQMVIGIPCGLILGGGQLGDGEGEEKVKMRGVILFAETCLDEFTLKSKLSL